MMPHMKYGFSAPVPFRARTPVPKEGFPFLNSVTCVSNRQPIKG